LWIVFLIQDLKAVAVFPGTLVTPKTQAEGEVHGGRKSKKGKRYDMVPGDALALERGLWRSRVHLACNFKHGAIVRRQEQANESGRRLQENYGDFG
jgi:hypothetical protein